MVHKKDASVVLLALLVAFSAAPRSVAALAAPTKLTQSTAAPLPSGNLDWATVRAATAPEKAQGLTESILSRKPIAMNAKADLPFTHGTEASFAPQGHAYQESTSPVIAASLRLATASTSEVAIAPIRPLAVATTSNAPAASSVASSKDNTEIKTAGLPGWLWLLPLALLAGLIWWLLQRRNQSADGSFLDADRPVVVPPPEPVSPPDIPDAAADSLPSVAARTESIVASDRAARSPAAEPPAVSPPAAEPLSPLGAAGIAGGAMFGAGAIADAMHSADDDAGPVADQVSAADLAPEVDLAPEDLTAENLNTLDAAESLPTVAPAGESAVLLPVSEKNFAQAADPWASIAPPGAADDVTTEPAIAPPIGESGQLMREPAIADDPLAPPAVSPEAAMLEPTIESTVPVEAIDELAAVNDTAADFTPNEAAMLDVIEDEVADLPPLEEASATESTGQPSGLSEQVILAGGAALAAGGLPMVGDAFGARSDRDQSMIEAARFDVGPAVDDVAELAAVDQDLPDLPDGYGESRIVLLPRDPQWAYVYWDVPIEHKNELRRQGGSRLALRLYDVTDRDLMMQRPHSLQQYECDELARDWYLAIPLSDRDYLAEIGYVTEDGRWLMLARSAPVRVPPVYPSDWFEDQFLTVEWEEDLRGKTFLELIPPEQKAASATTSSPIYEQIFDLAESTEAQRIAGSLYGSMQQLPQQAISSFVFPSGVGMWAAPFEQLAFPTPSGMGMSGIGMSGVGFSASIPPIRPRQFWLVADAELIVYGATEPDATVTIGGRPIKLNPDGTFRFQMSFQDGLIDYPIMAVAADGEQTRSIHMSFTRETPERNTNTKDDAIEEWP